MKRLLFSFIVLGITSVLAIGATTAYFSDTEISSANTFTAGTLDLKVDNSDEDVTAKFSISNMQPGSVLGANGTGLFTAPGQTQCTGGAGYTIYYALQNAGTLNGYFNITNVSFTNLENDRLEPEIVSGDTSDAVGELLGKLKVRVWLDNGNSCIDGSEQIYSGNLSDMNSVMANRVINAGETQYLGLAFYWEPSTVNSDNQAMGDSVQMNLTFGLSQVTL